MSLDVITLGCRLKASESEAMRVLACAEQDLVIVESCAVTNEAVRQTRQAIRSGGSGHAQNVAPVRLALTDSSTLSTILEGEITGPENGILIGAPA